MPENSRLVIYPALSMVVSSGLSSSMDFVDHIFFCTWSMCHFDVAILLERKWVTSCTVIPGHDRKRPFWISSIHVYFTGINDTTNRYLTKSVWFVMWYDLCILCSMSLSSCGLLFSKGTLHNPVDLSLFPVNIIFSSLMMRKFLCVKTALQPTSHILTMEINGMCVSPPRIWPSIYFEGSYGNLNVNSLADSIVSSLGRTTLDGHFSSVVFAWELLGLI